LANSVPFNNYGSVEILAGILSLGGGGQNHGIMDFCSGTMLELSAGTFSAPAGSSMVGAGQLRLTGATATLNGLVNLSGNHTFNGGTANLNGNYICTNNTLAISDNARVHFNGVGPVTPSEVVLSGGTLGGSGVVTALSQMTWTGGTMGGSGRTVIAAGATLAIDNQFEVILQNRTLDNGGTIEWTGSTIFMGAGVITNRPGGLFHARNNASLALFGTPTRFDNAGVFRKTSSGTTTLANSVPFNNYGTVEILAGTLLANGGYNSRDNALLHCAIGGTDAGTGYGRVQSAGAANLTGALKVSFTESFIPTTHDAFTVLTAATRNGAFGDFQYPSDRVAMQLDHTSTSVIVRVTDVILLGQPILALPELAGPNIRLTWSALSNTTYRLEYITDLGLTNWTALPGDVTSPTDTASKLDALTSSNRFYRVRAIP